MTFKMNYDGDKPEQSNVPNAIPANAPVPHVEQVRKTFVLPSILKTTATFLVAGAVFFGIEGLAPDPIKPSTMLGTYEARLHAAMKAAELQQQAKYDSWAIRYKYTYDENLEQYRAVTQGMIRNYDASYQLNNTFASGYIQLNQQYKGVLYNYTMQTRSADMGVLNLSRSIGLIFNALEPGAGDSALNYSNRLDGEMRSQLRSAAADDFPIEFKDWQDRLATPAEVRAELESIKLAPPPPMPQLWEDAPRQDFAASSSNAH